MFMPVYSSNIYRFEIEDLEKLYVSIVPSKALSTSIANANKLLKILIADKRWQGKAFVYNKDKYLVLLSSREEIIHELINALDEFRRHSSALPNYPFTEIPSGLESVAYAALSKSLEHYVLLSLNKEGWTILAGRKAYTGNNSELTVDLPKPLADYVRLYRGVQLATLPLILYNVFGTQYLDVGLCIDPVLIIEPSKSLHDILNEGLEYNENKLLRKNVLRDEQFGYEIVKYEVWDILNISNDRTRVKALRIVRTRGGIWDSKVEEFDLKNVYPLRRPEVVDRTLHSKYSLTKMKTLTYIIKKESFHITEEGKKDEQAPRKRYIVTIKFQRIIKNAISNHKFLGELKVSLEDKPLSILFSK